MAAPFHFDATASRGMREPPSGAAWHGSSPLALGLVSPLPAAGRFRKLPIIEQGVHQAERYPGKERFRVREGVRQPRSHRIMPGDLARPTACISCTLPHSRRRRSPCRCAASGRAPPRQPGLSSAAALQAANDLSGCLSARKPVSQISGQMRRNSACNAQGRSMAGWSDFSEGDTAASC